MQARSFVRQAFAVQVHSLPQRSPLSTARDGSSFIGKPPRVSSFTQLYYKLIKRKKRPPLVWRKPAKAKTCGWAATAFAVKRKWQITSPRLCFNLVFPSSSLVSARIIYRFCWSVLPLLYLQEFGHTVIFLWAANTPTWCSCRSYGSTDRKHTHHLVRCRPEAGTTVPHPEAHGRRAGEPGDS